MGVFTLELYKVLEITGATLDENGEYVVDWSKIGLGTYDIFDEAHRDVLNKKIVDRYLNREIGVETIEKFVHGMKRKMNEIMPAYNELYKSVIDYDILSTVDIRTITDSTTNSDRESAGESTANTTAGAKSRAINSDFPQFALAGNADYATSGADSNASNTSTAGSTQEDHVTGTDVVEAESRTTGYQGSPADLILRARSAIINIDLAIIDEVSPLFMLVWDNGDEWSPSNWKGLDL